MPALLVHSEGAGRAVIESLGRAARVDAALHGVPARVLPLEVWHTASVGIDLWLTAIAHGASQVWVLVTHEEAPDYREAIAAQMAVAQAILTGLGLAGEHFRLIGGGEVSRQLSQAASGIATAAAAAGSGPAPRRPPLRARSDPSLLRLDQALQRAPATTVRRAATFAVQADKRVTLDLAIDHLMQQCARRCPRRSRCRAPTRRHRPVRQPGRRPRGLHALPGLRGRLSRGGARRQPGPAAAALHREELRAVRPVRDDLPGRRDPLVPRLLLAGGGKARREARVLNEAEPFCCVRCAKPFGTLRAVEAMAAKLSGARHVPGRGRRAAAHVRRLPGDRHPQQRRRSADRRAVSSPQPLEFASPGDGEELARAEVYGLVAQLFYAPPGEALHAGLQTAVTVAPQAGGILEQSWGELVGAARRLTRTEMAAEFDALFQGIGKPEIFLYASFQLTGKLNDKPLVALRHELRALGLERPDGLAETEDHLAAVCEVMRYLIAGDDVATSNLATQRRFFDAHLRSWAEAVCETVAAHPRADFYRAAAVVRARLLRRRSAGVRPARRVTTDRCRGAPGRPRYPRGTEIRACSRFSPVGSAPQAALAVHELRSQAMKFLRFPRAPIAPAIPSPSTAIDRRSLVVGAGVAGAAALAAAALHRGAAEAPVAVAAKTAAAPDEGYRETPHVLRYYETTRS